VLNNKLIFFFAKNESASMSVDVHVSLSAQHIITTKSRQPFNHLSAVPVLVQLILKMAQENRSNECSKARHNGKILSLRLTPIALSNTARLGKGGGVMKKVIFLWKTR
jgi:hypothetical protein